MRWDDSWDDALGAVTLEAIDAEAIYGPYHSSHEALGVLIEEVDELKAAIHENDREAVKGEAIQVAAVAMRLALCCDLDEFRKRSGMGK